MSSLSKFLLYLAVILIIAAGVLWFIGGKKMEYSTEATLDTSPDKVFYFLKDTGSFAEWIDGYTDYITDDDSPLSRGVTGELVVNEKGRKVPYQLEVIKFESDKLISVQRSNGSIISTSIFKLEETSNYQTKLIYKVKESYQGIQRAISVFQKSETQERIQSELRALKKYIENNLDKAISDLPDPNIEFTPAEKSGDQQQSANSQSAGEQQNKPEEAFGFESKK